MPSGRFVTFEGGEGTGKSTQSGILAERLRAEGILVCETREPGGTQLGEAVRRLLVEGPVDRINPISELFLYAAARSEHIKSVIAPALSEGKWVVCDRFADSTTAYQGYGHKLGTHTTDDVYNLIQHRIMPDLTLIFDLPIELGLRRAARRHGPETRYESMNLAYHERIRSGFLEIASHNPERCQTINSDTTIEDTATTVWEIVHQRLLRPS